MREQQTCTACEYVITLTVTIKQQQRKVAKHCVTQHVQLVTGFNHHCADAKQQETAAEKEEVYFVFDVLVTDDIGLLKKISIIGNI